VKVTLSRKRVYGFIAIILVVCLSLSVFLSLGFSAKVSLQAQSDAQPEASATPNQAADANTSNSNITSNASTANTNSENNSLITEDDALRTAMPYINQYATENNRAITNVTATFHTDWGSRPVWDVFGRYDRTNITGSEYWIIGYEVVIRADNGEIDYQQAYGIM
jgi:hypothetical protein